MPGQLDVDARAGVVFRVAEELWFLPASIAVKVIPSPPSARIPGAPPELRGVALVDGDMIPVVDLGSGEVPSTNVGVRTCTPTEQAAMLVCTVLGERVGLVGADIVATGRFEPGGASGEINANGETARIFDVAAVIARVREGRWAV